MCLSPCVVGGDGSSDNVWLVAYGDTHYSTPPTHFSVLTLLSSTLFSVGLLVPCQSASGSGRGQQGRQSDRFRVLVPFQSLTEFRRPGLTLAATHTLSLSLSLGRAGDRETEVWLRYDDDRTPGQCMQPACDGRGAQLRVNNNYSLKQVDSTANKIPFSRLFRKWHKLTSSGKTENVLQSRRTK